MRALVQRVSRAAVRVDGQTIGAIGPGLMVLLGIGRNDTEQESRWIINKLLNLRIFADDAGKMNRSVTDIGGGLLVVSQFTLYGDVTQGMRPGFTPAMPPGEAEIFYHEFLKQLRAATALQVQEGKFGAMMDVELVNDGPVTIMVEVEAPRADQPVGYASRLSSHASRVGSTPNLSSLGKIASLENEPPIDLFVPFDPEQPIAVSTRKLPHARQPGCTYFVTFRLADSLPQEKLSQWEKERQEWHDNHPPPHSVCELREYHQRFNHRIERWLDEGSGSCHLRQPEISRLVADALHHFHGDRYLLGQYAIMPNHVHVLVSPLGEHELSAIEHSWKSFTAHEINRKLQRTGNIWQRESFDHIVRKASRLAEYEQYIRKNPEMAKLRQGEFIVGHGDPNRSLGPREGTREI